MTDFSNGPVCLCSLNSNLNKKSKLGELLNEYDYDLPVTTEELSARLQKEVEKEKFADTRKAPEISENRLSVNQLAPKLFGGSLKDIMEMPEVIIVLIKGNIHFNFLCRILI